MATFALCLIHTITALPVGNLARVVTPVSLLNPPVQSVLLSQKNKRSKLHKGNAVSKSKRGTLLVFTMMNLLGDEDVDSFTGSHADLQSAADYLFTSPPRPQPLPFSSLSIKTQKLSHPPQVLPYSSRLNQIWKNPWVTHLTSIYSSKWVPSRHLC